MDAAGVALLSNGMSEEVGSGAYIRGGPAGQPGLGPPNPHPVVPRITHDSSLGPPGRYLLGPHKALPLD